MSASEMSRGQIIAIVSAVALVVSLFLAWGGSSVDIPEGVPVPEGIDDTVSGWESQNTLDIYLAILGALVIGNAVMMFMGNPEGLPFAPAAAAFLLGVIGTIMTAYVVIDIPEGAEREIGLWVALASVIGVTIGSFIQMRDEVFDEVY